jgi:hypothetical protein
MIDISYVEYWGPLVIIVSSVFAVVAVALLTLAIIATVKNWGGRYGETKSILWFLFAGSLVIGSILAFGIFGGGAHKLNEEKAKISELKKLGYANIDFNEDVVTASKDGKYVKLYLEKQEDGRFLVLEAKAAK